MRSPKVVVQLILAVLSCGALAQTNVPSVSAALNILAPKNGEKISADFVTVKYALASPASAASTPTFQLRLDSHDAIETTDTQYTFTSLPAGTHIVTVQLVDANNMPIPGAQSQVQFTTVGPQNRGAPASPGAASISEPHSEPHLQTVSLVSQKPASGASHDQSKSQEQANGNPLPASGSPLPLLSVIGMGVLVGGIASALKTRHGRGPSR